MMLHAPSLPGLVARFAATLALGLGLAVLAAPTALAGPDSRATPVAAEQSAPADPKLEECLGHVRRGAYPSGLMETWCDAVYDLPSPWTMQCLRYLQDDAFPDALTRQACTFQLVGLLDRYGDWPKGEEP